MTEQLCSVEGSGCSCQNFELEKLMTIPPVCFQLGFFRRRKHEELKQKREELENLNYNAKSLDETTSTDNIVDCVGTN